jgi:hypothetical protein
MQLTLSPYLLDITPVLLALEASPIKKVPKYHKETFFYKYLEILTPHYNQKEIDHILTTQQPVFISYKTSPEAYLYWFALKLSMISRDGIQTALNYAHQTYPNENIFEKIKNVVLKNLIKNWTWTTKSTIDEIKVWLHLTIPVSKSIFQPEYRELIYLELVPKLIDSKNKSELFNLIYFNKYPKETIGLRYNSMQELCIIPSLIKKKKQINLSYSELANWIKKSFNILNHEGSSSTVNTSSITRYLDSKNTTPHHVKNWFTL